MKLQISKGSTDVILVVFIQNSAVTDGSGLAGLIQTSSITGGYVKRDGLGVALAVDEDVDTEGTYQAPSTAAQVRIGTPANMIAGIYELHFHDDLFTTADWVTVTLSGASNMAPLTLEIQLTSVDLNDAANGGMSRLAEWADGGRLDLLLDAIPTTDVSLSGSVDDASPAVGDFDGNAGLSGTDNFYNGAFLVFTNGTLRGIGRQITSYNGTSKNFVFSGVVGDADEPFPVAPSNGDVFVILGRFEA